MAADNSSYTFSEIYDGSKVPTNAYPASGLRLYDVIDAEVLEYTAATENGN